MNRTHNNLYLVQMLVKELLYCSEMCGHLRGGGQGDGSPGEKGGGGVGEVGVEGL